MSSVGQELHKPHAMGHSFIHFWKLFEVSGGGVDRLAFLSAGQMQQTLIFDREKVRNGVSVGGIFPFLKRQSKTFSGSDDVFLLHSKEAERGVYAG